MATQTPSRNKESRNKERNKEGRQSYTSKKSAKYGLVWERDSEVSSCRGCLTPFSVTFRRHHCRNCGKIFCNTCSSERASVSGSKRSKRVCKWCKLKLAPTGFNRLSLDSDVDAVSVGVGGDGNNCGDMGKPDVSTAEVAKRPKAAMLGSACK